MRSRKTFAAVVSGVLMNGRNGADRSAKMSSKLWIVPGRILAQHADRQLDFQREALELIVEAVAMDEAEARHLAYLTDRVRMNDGREQLYDTQVSDVIEGAAIPWPIENERDVDDRTNCTAFIATGNRYRVAFRRAAYMASSARAMRSSTASSG